MRRPKSNLAKTREPNWQKRTMWTGNNLDILRGMNSASADLIYLAPPFNSNRTHSALIGSEAAGAAFKDTWTLSDVDEGWHGEVADREPTIYAAGLGHGKGISPTPHYHGGLVYGDHPSPGSRWVDRGGMSGENRDAATDRPSFLLRWGVHGMAAKRVRPLSFSTIWRCRMSRAPVCSGFGGSPRWVGSMRLWRTGKPNEITHDVA